ncbi:MAG: thymidylate kinase [Fimbriimonadales bacterium]
MFVALEGIDGSGKGTQAKILHQRCLKKGLSCFKLAFPQYGRTPFADAITEYLNGAYGGVRDVHPKLAALLFAADRFASREQLIEACHTHSLVVADRYVASNLAHQAAKLVEKDRDAFIAWLTSIEYSYFGLPQADLTIYLEIPLKHARKLVSKKGGRDQHSLFLDDEQGAYTSLKADIHEQDAQYLAACKQVYEHLRDRQVGGKWVTVSCVSGDELRQPAEIGDEIFALATI